MIDKLLPQSCALCGSCADACPVSAIFFRKPYLDFNYPQIDTDACINCGLCEKVCPVLNTPDAPPQVSPRVYAAKNPDEAVRRKSTSGGIFRAMADNILSRGGYVCGAVFDERFQVHHIVSNKADDIDRMMGSKYAQSDLSGVYRQIKQLLHEGAPVLFTGCPCQVAGLHSFLGKKYDTLITADLICHGIPSGTMLRAYLDLQEQKYRSKIQSLCFRDKKHGWHRSSVRIRFANGAEYCQPITNDAYMAGFLGGIYLKESCYDCRFKEFRSGSDLTLGDFWGSEFCRPALDDNIGLSAVISNSEKGCTFLSNCGLELWEDRLNSVVCYNRNLITSTKKNPDRNGFYADAQTAGYSQTIKARLVEPPLKKFCRESRFLLQRVVYAVLGREKPLY